MGAQLPLFAPEDRTDPWRVRVSQRARRLSVRIYPGGKVEIVVPPRVPSALVERFIGQHRDWIDRRVTEWRAVSVPVAARPAELDLRAFGHRLPIVYRSAPGVTRARGRDGGLEVAGAVDDLKAVARALERWLRREAEARIAAELAGVAVAGDFRYTTLRIRRQRTRWGSCSSRGTVSINVCAAFLEPEVLRYLLVHELCHTKHMNHSRRFWALVERHEPDYRRLDRELTRGWQQVPPWILL